MVDKKKLFFNNNNKIDKILNKFLTIKKTPDKNIENQHFEKMLKVFWSTKEKDDIDIGELQDDELDYISAAGIGRPGYIICPYCNKWIREDLIEKHKIAVHKKT